MTVKISVIIFDKFDIHAVQLTNVKTVRKTNIISDTMLTKHC